MKASRPILCAAALASALFFGAPEDAAAKCSDWNAEGIALVVDRQVLGIFPNTPEGNSQRNAIFGAYRVEDITMVQLGCHDELNTTGGAVVRRQAVIVFTRHGEIKDWLREIVAAQTAFAGSNGGYAQSLRQLASHRSALSANTESLASRITISVTELGWSASYQSTDAGVVCHVFGGETVPPRPELVRGVPQCFVIDDPAPQTAPSTPLQIRVSQ